MPAVDLWMFDLDVGPERLAAFAGLLSDEENARADRFAFKIDRARFIAGRGQLREILGGLTGTPPALLTIVAGTNGKPSLPAVPRGPQFNISHCGGLALLGVSSTAAIGVDIEQVRPLQEDLDALVLTAREQADLAGLERETRLQQFHRLWTCKEAVVKARSTGLLTDPTLFSVAIPGGRHGSVEWVTPEDAALGPLIVQSFAPKPGYLAAVATMDLTQAATLTFRS